ncbi:MAG: hypothetical protein RSC93_02015 [Erysipelotrichaceae bacterium]
MSNVRVADTTGKKVTNYIDKVLFTAKINDYNKISKEAEEQGLPVPKIPDSIGVDILKLANGLGSRYNFSNYTYRDEMVGEAILSAVKAIRNRKFDGEKSSNAFSYFTTVMWYAMLNKMKEEKAEHEVKFDMLLDPTMDFFAMQEEIHQEEARIDKESAIQFFYTH